tara:strand:- start:1548 stop:2132 length:585 start_codon:yes stop_codon:yes gene_type:complete
MDLFKGLFDLSKLPAKFFVLFALVTGFILFANELLLEKIQLDSIKNTYGPIIGLVFAISAGLTLLNVFIWIGKKINFEWHFFQAKGKLRKRISELDDHEKAIFREFMICGQKSIEMPYDDPVVGGLMDAGLLRMNRQFGDSAIVSGRFAALSMGKYTEKYIRPHHVDLPKNPTDEEKQYIISIRPSWARKGIIR